MGVKFPRGAHATLINAQYRWISIKVKAMNTIKKVLINHLRNDFQVAGVATYFGHKVFRGCCILPEVHEPPKADIDAFPL